MCVYVCDTFLIVPLYPRSLAASCRSFPTMRSLSRFWAPGGVVLVGDAAHTVTPALGQVRASAYCMHHVVPANAPAVLMTSLCGVTIHAGHARFNYTHLQPLAF